MLEKKYMLPVLLGICLGVIMAGVQISAAALNAAVGPRQEIRLVVLERVDRSGARITILGKTGTVFELNKMKLIKYFH